MRVQDLLDVTLKIYYCYTFPFIRFIRASCVRALRDKPRHLSLSSLFTPFHFGNSLGNCLITFIAFLGRAMPLSR